MKDIVKAEGAGGASRLSLSFPRASVRGAGGALAASLSEEGSLVSGGTRCAAWSFESIAEGEGEALLVGPGFEGASLDSAKGAEDGLPLLLAAARAFELLSRESRLPRRIVSSGVLVGSGGDVLVLPAQAVARALAARGPGERAAAVARLSRPGSDGPEADASFLLAQAAYRFATGSNPYPREAAEVGGSAPPSPPVLSAALAAPRLDPELAALIDEALSRPGSVPLLRWRSTLDAAAGRGWMRQLGAEEEAELARRRVQVEETARRKDRASTFLRVRGGLMAGIAAAIVAIVLFAGSIVRARNDGPDLSGRTPRQVAQAYYLALDELDLETMEAATDKKALKGQDAAKTDENLATNVLVLSKTRIAYEQKDGLVRAAKWVAAGKPQIGQTDMLFGVTGLDLEDDGSVPSEAIGSTYAVRARYSLWFIEKRGEDMNAYSVPVEDKRLDDLVLKRTEKGWKIVELTRKPA